MDEHSTSRRQGLPPVPHQTGDKKDATAAMSAAEREIEAARESVSKELDRLRDEVEDALDWRDWLARNASACMLSAFVIGFWVGRRR